MKFKLLRDSTRLTILLSFTLLVIGCFAKVDVDRSARNELVAKAKALLVEGDIEASKIAFESLITSELDPVAGLHGLALIATDQKDFSQARQYYDKALPYIKKYTKEKSNRLVVIAHFNGYALLLKKSGHVEAAKNMYLDALKFGPDNYVVYMHLGEVYEYLGEPSKAVENYKEFLRLINMQPDKTKQLQQKQFAKTRVVSLESGGNLLQAPAKAPI